MFPGGMNPANMQRMMKQMGIKTEDISAKRVVFEMDGKNLILENPKITMMEVQGQKSYTVIGKAKEEAAGIPEEDIAMVAEKTGKSKSAAKKALEETNGDIAEAILKLS